MSTNVGSGEDGARAREFPEGLKAQPYLFLAR